MRYRQNTKGDILYGPPIKQQLIYLILLILKTIGKFLLYLINIIGTFVFIVMAGVSFWWLIFFKVNHSYYYYYYY